MLFIIVGLGSAALAALIVWLVFQARSAALAERARLAAESLARAEGELTSLRARATELEKQSAAAAEKISAFNEARERLTVEFKALASDALTRNSDEFLKRAGDSLV